VCVGKSHCRGPDLVAHHHRLQSLCAAYNSEGVGPG
jgi:hypothetical protein